MEEVSRRANGARRYTNCISSMASRTAPLLGWVSETANRELLRSDLGLLRFRSRDWRVVEQNAREVSLAFEQ